MDNIYIDYEQGISLGHKIEGEASDLINLLNEIKEIQEKLRPILNDSNDEKYLKAINSGIRVMDKMSETITETGNFLVTVSNAYAEAASDNSRNMY